MCWAIGSSGLSHLPPAGLIDPRFGDSGCLCPSYPPPALRRGKPSKSSMSNHRLVGKGAAMDRNGHSPKRRSLREGVMKQRTFDLFNNTVLDLFGNTAELDAVSNGKQYGSWTVLQSVAPKVYEFQGKYSRHARVLARCRCGFEKVLFLQTLQRGKSRQCNSCSGMHGRIDVVEGTKFGSWTVLREGPTAEMISRSGSPIQRRFHCRCSCGTKKLIGLNTLRAGTSTKCKSCAATLQPRSKRERFSIMTQEEASFRAVRRTYFRTARERGLLCTLTAVEMRQFFAGNCDYCGSLPSNRQTPATTSGRLYPGPAFVYNGIDRVNNNLGYVEGNCVSCCVDCNRAKRRMSKEEFLLWLRRLALHSLPDVKATWMAANPSNDYSEAETVQPT